jgi:hypothetical protein
MEAGPSAARQARGRHRHELRTLTYVTLDQANGGIVRNLSHDGIAVQAVAAVRPRQQLRVRFELRYPRLRVETRGEVVWSTFSGQCGIRFLDLSPRLVRQIDEWIFGDLLQGLSIPWERAGSVCIGSGPSAATSTAAVSSAARSMMASSAIRPSEATARVLRESEDADSQLEEPQADPVTESEKEDGLLVSPTPQKVIELRPPVEPFIPLIPPLAREAAAGSATPAMSMSAQRELDWLSQPLSGRNLVWTVNTLVVIAALLLFTLVFLSVTREAPKWPLTMMTVGAIVIGGLYWGFFKMFGGSSLGTRLANLAGANDEELEEARSARFR